jgi:ankyrin repeat protein
MADPSDYSTHENQLILAKQLIAHGANVNAVTRPEGETPLHSACHGCNVTNLDFVELLLKEGADPNAQDHTRGLTPLMITTPYAPGAAKFLLNWSTTDANLISRSGVFFLAWVGEAVECFYGKATLPQNPDKVQYQFLLQQWREIEEMTVKRGAVDTGITTL